MSTPRLWAEEREKLAQEYARMSGELEPIIDARASKWLAIRSNTKSDTSAQRQWENTQEGILEAKLKLKMKANQVLQSALSTKLRVAENEAHNLY